MFICSFMHSHFIPMHTKPCLLFSGKTLYIHISLYIPLLWDSLRRAKRLGGTANAKEWGIKVRFQYRGEVQPGGWGAADC